MCTFLSTIETGSQKSLPSPVARNAQAMFGMAPGAAWRVLLCLKACSGSGAIGLRRSGTLGVEVGQRLRDRAQLHLAEGTALPTRLRRQPTRQRHVNHQHDTDVGVEPTRSPHVAVIDTPEDLQTTVHKIGRAHV